MASGPEGSMYGLHPTKTRGNRGTLIQDKHGTIAVNASWYMIDEACQQHEVPMDSTCWSPDTKRGTKIMFLLTEWQRKGQRSFAGWNRSLQDGIFRAGAARPGKMDGTVKMGENKTKRRWIWAFEQYNMPGMHLIQERTSIWRGLPQESSVLLLLLVWAGEALNWFVSQHLHKRRPRSSRDQ